METEEIIQSGPAGAAGPTDDDSDVHTPSPKRRRVNLSRAQERRCQAVVATFRSRYLPLDEDAHERVARMLLKELRSARHWQPYDMIVDVLPVALAQAVVAFLDTSSHMVLSRCSKEVAAICSSPLSWPKHVLVRGNLMRLTRPQFSALSHLRPTVLTLVHVRKARSLWMTEGEESESEREEAQSEAAAGEAKAVDRTIVHLSLRWLSGMSSLTSLTIGDGCRVSHHALCDLAALPLARFTYALASNKHFGVLAELQRPLIVLDTCPPHAAGKGLTRLEYSGHTFNHGAVFLVAESQAPLTDLTLSSETFRGLLHHKLVDRLATFTKLQRLLLPSTIWTSGQQPPYVETLRALPPLATFSQLRSLGVVHAQAGLAQMAAVCALPALNHLILDLSEVDPSRDDYDYEHKQKAPSERQRAAHARNLETLAMLAKARCPLRTLSLRSQSHSFYRFECVASEVLQAVARLPSLTGVRLGGSSIASTMTVLAPIFALPLRVLSLHAEPHKRGFFAALMNQRIEFPLAELLPRLPLLVDLDASRLQLASVDGKQVAEALAALPHLRCVRVPYTKRDREHEPEPESSDSDDDDRAGPPRPLCRRLRRALPRRIAVLEGAARG